MLTPWSRLPKFEPPAAYPQADWLIHPDPFHAGIFRGESDGEIIATNGLISRTFRIRPNGTTVGFDNLMTGEALIRGIKPEARVELDGTRYTVGGLLGQVEYAYLRPEWLAALTADPDSFRLRDFRVGPIVQRFPWRRKRYATNPTWPPHGTMISFVYSHAHVPDVFVLVHYELYDGLPLLAKWLTVENHGTKSVRLNTFTSEILAMVEMDSVPQGDANRGTVLPPIHVESDYIFAAMSPKTGDVTTVWEKDPQYTTQVAYLSDARVQLESKPPLGPDIEIAPGETFESFRTVALVFDSSDRERRGLAQRKMYRTIAPWVTENPILMHVTVADPESVEPVIDQCAEVGFEMVILSFGCGMDVEWDASEFYEKYRALFDYAHERGIEIGTYSLFSSRSIGPEVDVVDPKTNKPNTHARFGQAPCLASSWGFEYLKKLRQFMERTGADVLEHDGPYPGDVCASKRHVGHRGLPDSQWAQWKAQSDFYKYCRAHGIYVNAPDWYFLSGSNKTGMGYKEVNWSLPRERQIMLARQNMYDGTWEKTPSMGWMFTPLTVYHAVGDSKESTLEPLSEHLDTYEAHLAQNFGAGVQSCYRGRRLYDSEETKAVVKEWVDFYKKYRDILDSDIVHIRRPDGRHVDGYIHVNPRLSIKGLAMLFNPLGEMVRTEVRLPLYYTGLTETALISERGECPRKVSLDRRYDVEIEAVIPAQGRVWYTLSEE